MLSPFSSFSLTPFEDSSLDEVVCTREGERVSRRPGRLLESFEFERSGGRYGGIMAT